MSADALVDTNVLVYAYDESEPNKREVCLKLLDSVWHGEVILAVSIQNLAEFYRVMTSKISVPLSKAAAREIVESILAYEGWTVLIPSTSSFHKAMVFTEHYHTSIWDASIAAVMLENGVHTIYTENTKDFQMLGIRAINPFKGERNVKN